MAEISSGDSQRRKIAGVSKLKKLSTRVDLTPMVDLGFLLLTFFIFTTALNQPTVMKMFLPDDSEDSIPVKRSGALTLLIGKNNSVFYYEGELNDNGSNVKKSSLSAIREILIRKKQYTAVAKDFVVIIKPSTNSIYGNLVDVVDEMTINDIKRYAVVDITSAEEALMN